MMTAMGKPKGLRLEITEDSQGNFRWAVFDGAGTLCAKGCIGYSSEQAAVEGVKLLGGNIERLLGDGYIFTKSYDPIREESRWTPWR